MVIISEKKEFMIFLHKLINENISLGMGFKAMITGKDVLFPHLYRWTRGLSSALDFDSFFKIYPGLLMGIILHNIGPNIVYVESGSTNPCPGYLELDYLPSR